MLPANNLLMKAKSSNNLTIQQFNHSTKIIQQYFLKQYLAFTDRFHWGKPGSLVGRVKAENYSRDNRERDG